MAQLKDLIVTGDTRCLGELYDSKGNSYVKKEQGSIDTLTKGFTFNNVSLIKGTAPSAEDSILIGFCDKNGTDKVNRMGQLACYTTTSNQTTMQLATYSSIAGDSSTRCTFTLSAFADGTFKANCSAPLYGAVWNDYAEFRATKEKIIPGHVVIENGDGTMSISNKRLIPGASIVSDTFGFAIGETEECKTPIATAGRVLAYTDKDVNNFKAGDAVCAGKNGKVSKMTRLEKILFPDCILGYVSEIPNYEIWGENNTQVNGRIWIKI